VGREGKMEGWKGRKGGRKVKLQCCFSIAHGSQEELQILHLSCSLLVEEEVGKREQQLHRQLEEKKNAKVGKRGEEGREGGREEGRRKGGRKKRRQTGRLGDGWMDGWMDGRKERKEGQWREGFWFLNGYQ